MGRSNKANLSKKDSLTACLTTMRDEIVMKLLKPRCSFYI